MQHIKHPEASQTEICKTDGHALPRKKDGEHDPSYHMGAPPPASSVPPSTSLLSHSAPFTQSCHKYASICFPALLLIYFIFQVCPHSPTRYGPPPSGSTSIIEMGKREYHAQPMSQHQHQHGPSLQHQHVHSMTSSQHNHHHSTGSHHHHHHYHVLHRHHGQRPTSTGLTGHGTSSLLPSLNRVLHSPQPQDHDVAGRSLPGPGHSTHDK